MPGATAAILRTPRSLSRPRRYGAVVDSVNVSVLL